MQTVEATTTLKTERQLRFEVELAMNIGGRFEDCMTPAQAVELVRELNTPARRRPGLRQGAMKKAA